MRGEVLLLLLFNEPRMRPHRRRGWRERLAPELELQLQLQLHSQLQLIGSDRIRAPIG